MTPPPEVVQRSYLPTADDIRPCASCGDSCQGFPHRASVYCPVCALRILECGFGGLMHDLHARYGDLRAALREIAPAVLAAIEQSADRFPRWDRS